MRLTARASRIAFALLPFCAAIAAAAETTPAPAAPSCADLPFVFNDFWTTTYGPAKADIITQPSTTTTEMLECSQAGVEYALCAYSGPASGPDAGDPPLPCRLEQREGKLVALCECYALSTTSTSPYYVDINAILNTCVYIETVRVCGPDGSNCGRGKSTPPVCTYIADNTLMPGADLVSTFSLAKAGAYGGPNACTWCQGRYAGCMTAACKRVPGKQNVICECPVAEGAYQVVQNDVSCYLSPPNTWSASNNVTTDRKVCPPGPTQPTTQQNR